MMLSKQKMNALRTELMRVKDASTGPKIRQCEERFTQLVGDIFIGKLTNWGLQTDDNLYFRSTIKTLSSLRTIVIYVIIKITGV